MPIVESRGARIHWESAGEGTPVLLIMGHLYSSRLWYPLLPALTGRHRAIWFDNRGTGGSDTTPGVTIADFAADAIAVMDAAGVEKAHVHGVSMGGGIAAELAMAYPERVLSVTLGCTMIKTEKIRIDGARRLIYRLPRWLVRAVFKRTMKPERYGSRAPLDKARHDIGVVTGDSFTMAGARAQARAIAAYATTHERAAARITMPVLVLHGDEDEAVPVEKGREIARVLPHARYVEFPGCGHNYLVADNEASTQAFLDFIAGVDRATAPPHPSPAAPAR